MTPLRIAFVGAVESSEVAFEALVAADLAPGMLVTLDPARAARHSDYRDLGPPAQAAGTRVHLTDDVNAPGTVAALAKFSPDLCLVIGWSQICRSDVLGVPRLGSIGFHPSALPRLRGRAVIPWTIILGENETGSSLFVLDADTDTGALMAQRRFTLDPRETARSLYDRHAANLALMLPEAVRDVARDGLHGAPQSVVGSSICAKRGPEDGRIRWSDPVEAVDRLVRALCGPYPSAFSAMSASPERRLEIDAVRVHEGGPIYHGFAGQVQARTEDGFLVLCGDGRCVEVLNWTFDGEGQRQPPMHARFGG